MIRPVSMTKSYDAVALTLFSWFKYKKQNYGIIARAWLRDQVKVSQGVDINIRTLDRALARMRHLGLLYSETRHRRDTKTGEFIPEVSILYFTDELKSYVAKLFRFFKRLFGFKDLTEYTVTVIPSKKANSETNPLTQSDPPPKHPESFTAWNNLGKGRSYA